MEKFQHHLNLSLTPDVSFSCHTQHTRRRLFPLSHTGEDFSHCRTQHAGEDFAQCRTQHAGRRLLPTVVHSMQEKTFATVAHSVQEKTSPNVAHSTGCIGRSLIGHRTPHRVQWEVTDQTPHTTKTCHVGRNLSVIPDLPATSADDPGNAPQQTQEKHS